MPSISSFGFAPSILNAQTLTFRVAWQCTVCQFSTTRCTFKHNESIWCENMLAFPPSLSPAVFVRENVSGISQQVCLTFFCLCSLYFFPCSPHTLDHTRKAGGPDLSTCHQVDIFAIHPMHIDPLHRTNCCDVYHLCISFSFVVLLYN